MSRTHVVGAGLAGLAAAVALARRGRAVALYEASGQAGGRCRSFLDETLGRVIDNGNHLLLSGNEAAMRYLDAIGAADALAGPDRAAFPFLDLRTGQRWTLRPSAGRLPLWVFHPDRRVPDTRLRDYLGALRLPLAGPDRTVAGLLGGSGPLFERFWEPLAVAALNTPAREGAARLLWPVLRETFARGEAACRPRMARTGLSDALVDPALAVLRRLGAEVRFGARLRAVGAKGGRAARLEFGDATVELGDGEDAILAVPPQAAAGLLPDLAAPQRSHAIVNVHFRLPEPAPAPEGGAPVGLVGGTAQWVFARGDIASVTVSAADALAAEPAGEIARRTWRDVARALDLDAGAAPPPWRVVKERRATFAQTPEEARRRPGARTALANLFLAGDWTDTGLPATIEGAIRSGEAAVRAAGGQKP